MISNGFIILGRQRTGSIYLESLLNSHSKIFSGGEILIQPKNLMKRLEALFILPKEIKKMNLLIKEKRYVEYIDYYFSLKRSLKVSINGFRYFHNHLVNPYRKDVLNYFINNKNLKIINLQRNNLLKSYLSIVLAKKNKLWWTHKSIFINTKVNLDYEKCVEFFLQIKKEVGYYNGFFSHSDKLDVYYEDLNNNKDKEIKRILEFLGSNQEILNSPMKKINKRDLKEVISNYSELKKKFKDTPWINFFEE